MSHTPPKFTPTRVSLPISLLRTRELIMEEVRPMLHRHDMTEQQWRVLRVVAEEGEADATTIADRACLLAPSLTRILRTLQDRGLIESHRDAKDARRILITLTEKGYRLIDRLAPESAALFDKLRTIVGEERWQMLVELLTDIRDDIQAARRDQSDEKP